MWTVWPGETTASVGGVHVHVKPRPPAGDGGGFGDELQVVVRDRLRDRVGGGVYGDLELLIPQLRLPAADLAVQLVALVAELQLLLAELEQGDRDQRATEETDEELDHGGTFGGASRDDW